MSTHRHIFARQVSPLASRTYAGALPTKKSTRNSRYWNDRRIVADQKMTPHCVGFAWCHWLDCDPIRQFIDPHGLYEGCKLIDGAPNEDGTYVLSAAEILKKLGFISEYRAGRTLKQLVYAVLELGPVVVGTDWYEGMEEGPTLQLTGEVLGGHAYLVMGANQKKRTFKIKNSWGREWGDDGHALISFDDMETLLKADGECCLATEAQPQTKWVETS